MQYKIVADGEILCVFSICYSDEIIWRDKEQGNAIYIHRAVVTPRHRGQKQFARIQGTESILNLPVFIESSVSDGVYPLPFTNVVISDTSFTDISTLAPTIGEITIGTLGIDDFTNSDNEFTLYPNPTSNRFFFKSNTYIDNVEIYGRTILITKYNENGIDIQHLSNGMYFVKSYNNNNSKIFKLIKK